MASDGGWTTTSKKAKRPKATDRSAKRLLRDLRELKESPLVDAHALPLDSNVFVWHANIKGTYPPFEGTVFHFKFTFPETYPRQPPKVEMVTPVPHRNVRRAQGGRFTVCSNMLGGVDNSVYADKEYEGWCSAYSVSTILLQLQTLLMPQPSDDAAAQTQHAQEQSRWLRNNGMTIEQVVARAQEYRCEETGHAQDSPWPALNPKPIENKKRSVVRVMALPSYDRRSAPTLKSLQAPARKIAFVNSAKPAAKPSAWGSAPKQQPSALQKPTPQPVAKPAVPQPGKAPAPQFYPGQLVTVLFKGNQFPAKVLGAGAKKGFLSVEYSGCKGQAKQAPVFAVKALPALPVAAKAPQQRSAPAPRRPAPLGALVAQPVVPMAQFAPAPAAVAAPAAVEVAPPTKKPRRVPGAASPVTASPAPARRLTFKPSGRSIAPKVKSVKPSHGRVKWGKMTSYQQKSNAQVAMSNIFSTKAFAAADKAERKAAAALAKAAERKAGKAQTQARPYRFRFAVVCADTLTCSNKNFKPVCNFKKGANLRVLGQSAEGKRVLVRELQGKRTGWCSMKTRKGKPLLNFLKNAPKTAKAKQQAPKQKARRSVPGATAVISELAKSTPACKPAPQPAKAYPAPKPAPKQLLAVPAPAMDDRSSISGMSLSMGSVSLASTDDTSSEGSHDEAGHKRDLILASIDRKGLEGSAINVLDRTVTLHAFSFLSLKDLARVSSVCTTWRSMAQEGYLWRDHFAKRFPDSRLVAESMASWRYVFELESRQIVEGLQCFHTKTTFEEGILGIPISFSINPKTRLKQYFRTTSDLLSHEAYQLDKLRKTLWGEEFTDWLPVYLTKDHFKRALPLIKRSIFKLSNQKGARGFHPSMVLDVLPPLMNTMVVLLSDKGEAASEKALEGYCLVHRLFLALVMEFPMLRREIDNRLNAFFKSDENRHKSKCRDLGQLVPLLAVSDRMQWARFYPVYAQEAMARGIIWIGKANCDLIYNAPKNSKDMSPADMRKRIDETFEVRAVSNRLAMFHAYFNNRLHRGCSTYEMAATYDRYYGRPSMGMMSQFQGAVKEILAVDGYDQFWKHVGLRKPSDAALTDMLLKAILESKRKKYHSNTTNFSAIHSSGVSKILLKGESYAVAPNMKRVHVEDHWRCEGSFSFLDMSVLMFGQKFQYHGAVDYSSTIKQGLKHSGDICDYATNGGKHTVDINLGQLPKQVHKLVFVVTCWNGNFNQFLDPYICITDPNNGNEMARFAKPAETTRSCVVMAQLKRKANSSEWEFKALGDTLMATARNYDPIVRHILGRPPSYRNH